MSNVKFEWNRFWDHPTAKYFIGIPLIIIASALIGNWIGLW